VKETRETNKLSTASLPERIKLLLLAMTKSVLHATVATIDRGRSCITEGCHLALQEASKAQENMHPNCEERERHSER